MKVASSHHYAAPPDTVFAAMTDPSVLAEKYTALGHHDIEIIEHSVTKSSVSVRSRRSVPVEVPGFAKRFISPVNKVEQRDRWGAVARDGSRSGTWEVNAKGVPVKVGGTLRLAPDGDGTVVEILGEVTSSVPLVGGRLASYLGGDVERTIHAEEAFNDEYLGKVAPAPRRRRPPAKP